MVSIISLGDPSTCSGPTSDLPFRDECLNSQSVLKPSVSNEALCNDAGRNAQILKRSHYSNVITQRVWTECFGKEALERRGLSFEGVSLESALVNLRSFHQLRKIPIEGEEEKGLGFALLKIPKGLTLNKLHALISTPLPPHKPLKIRTFNPVIKNLGDVVIEEGVVAISTGLLENSKGLSVENQTRGLARVGCRLPRVVEVVALLALTYFNSSSTGASAVRLLTQRHTHCLERIEFPLTVGGFDSAGIFIGDFDFKYLGGAVVLREL